MDIAIAVEEKDGLTIAMLSGELNSSTAEQVQARLLELIGPGCKIVLDMSGVNYISSVGLRALLLLYRETMRQDGRIVLCGLTEMVYDTMFITGFLDFFETFATCAEGQAGIVRPL
ncbi:MAG: STAS domain-containing protein [Candidatus Promineifilaceae bacterium]